LGHDFQGMNMLTMEVALHQWMEWGTLFREMHDSPAFENLFQAEKIEETQVARDYERSRAGDVLSAEDGDFFEFRG
jgi:hypothetical protein